MAIIGGFDANHRELLAAQISIASGDERKANRSLGFVDVMPHSIARKKRRTLGNARRHVALR
jgi:hypothetical protein